MLRRSPGFTILAVLTLALGIGANTALFSVVNAVLLSGFGYVDPANLLEISGINKKGQTTGVSLPDFQAFQARARSFEHIAVSRVQTFTLNGPRELENLYGQLVSRECFDVLGSRPVLGRTFVPGDFDSGAPLVAMISDPLWRTSFSEDPAIAGRRVVMNGAEYTVIGVMEPGFQFPHSLFKVWSPWKIGPEDLANRIAHNNTLIARLRPGVKPAAAQAELESLSLALAREFPATNDGWRAVAAPINERVIGNLRPALTILSGAVGFVLLIACLNVANLLVSRVIERQREMAVRAALGAGRLRLTRQLFGESLRIAVLGGAAGLLFAHWGLRALIASLHVRVLPRLELAGIDGRVLLVSGLLSMASALVFGLFPAIQLSRPNLELALRESSRGATASRRSRRFRSGLIVLETALSVVLLVGAGLMIRSFLRTMQVNPGFRPEHVLTAQIPSPWAELSRRNTPDETARQVQYFHDIVERVQTMPGVSAAAIVTVLPLGIVHIQTRIFIEGRPAPGPGEDIRVQYRGVSADYFRVMGIPLLRGRGFTENDRAGQPAVVVVNEALARAFWPREDAVGKRISMGSASGPWIDVVGVVAGVRHDRLTADPDPELYTSYRQTLLAPQVSTVVLKTPSEPETLAASVRAAIHQVNPNQPVSEVKTMTQVVEDAVAQPRLYTVLLAIFAGLALLLAAGGIFAVISCTVGQSTHEIGIRMALGATPAAVLRTVIRRAVLEAMAGAALGLIVASLLMGVLKNQLYGIATTDPLTFAAVPLLLTLVALAATWLAARRATRVDPLAALRME